MQFKQLLRQKWELGLKPYTRTFLMWLVCASIAGVACGAVGAVFFHLVSWATGMRQAHPWLLYLLPVGGLVIVFVYQTCRMGTERGTNAVLESAQQGKRVRLNRNSQRVMVLAGMSAVFAALFGTPLTAAVFSMEVICVGVIYHAALLPCALASLISYGTAVMLGTKPERFVVHGAQALSLDNAWRATLLAVGCAVLGILFCVAMHTASHLYQTKLKNQYLRILVGSALIILFTLAVGTRAYNGAGMDVVEHAITEGELVHPAAFILKLLLTAITLGCGFRGGEIVPTFFVGSTFGCLVGPLLGLDPGLAAALALVATFCAVTNCPIASILLGVELFGAEPLLLYLLVCAVSYLLSGHYSLYSSQMTLGPKLTNPPPEKPVESFCH